MASACVNNATPPPDSVFLDFAPSCPVYGLLSPRISFSRDLTDDAGTAPGPILDNPEPSASAVVGVPDHEDLGNDFPDFEFRLDDPVIMLPADELFSDGKLIPLHTSAPRLQVELDEGKRSPEADKSSLEAEVLGSEPCEKSPKCSKRWRELLGLKKQQNPKVEEHKAAAASFKGLTPTTRSFRHLLRHPKLSSSADSSLAIPLRRDSVSESASIFARRSLSSSSSSSGTDHDELPRFSLDSERPAQAPILIVRAPPSVRLTRPRVAKAECLYQAERAGRSPVKGGAEAAAPRGASVDSPRMNASGKVVFQGLERSSSSPGSCHGGSHHHRGKPYRGVERSYSANVRVAPILNVVPVGSLRVGSSKPASAFGLAHLFTPSKKNPHIATGGGSRSKIVDKDKA
ncbi:hypothetical protein Cni_G00397 [Canna indica]|uniref:Uncharacterized protein n=1 Tax=Canna indica TaxID=4628 RepID=A0AAQ3JMN1_9LILI|nr:hypothetical protein Cni_G00397 [Canna indica]